MNTRRMLEWGGLAASVVLIIFGAAALYMGFDGRSTVQDSLKQEQIFFGEASDPAVAKYADQWAGQQVTTGEQARAFAQIMREHTIESSGGLTYAQMGRYQSAANPSDQKGTNDEAAAAKDDERPADRQRRPQPLGDGDGADHGAQHELHGGAALDLRDRGRDRTAPDRRRTDDPGTRSARRTVPRGGRRAARGHDEGGHRPLIAPTSRSETRGRPPGRPLSSWGNPWFPHVPLLLRSAAAGVAWPPGRRSRPPAATAA